MVSKVKFLIIFGALIMLGVNLDCPAQEKKDKVTTKVSSTEVVRRPRRFSRMSDEVAEGLLSRLSERNPARAAELRKLREKDPEQFRKELRETMRLEFEDETFGRGGRGMRGSMGMEHELLPGDPNEERGPRRRGGERFRSEGREKDGQGSRGERFGRGMAGRRGRDYMLRRQEAFVEWLGEIYPDQAKELSELKEKDRELYNRKLSITFSKYRRMFEASEDNPELASLLKENLELTEKQHELLKKIYKTNDKNEKQALTEELNEVLSAKYDLIIKRKQLALEDLTKKLEELKAKIEKSEEKIVKWKDPKFKEDNISSRLKELLGKSENFNWEE